MKYVINFSNCTFFNEMMRRNTYIESFLYRKIYLNEEKKKRKKKNIIN